VPALQTAARALEFAEPLAEVALERIRGDDLLRLFIELGQHRPGGNAAAKRGNWTCGVRRLRHDQRICVRRPLIACDWSQRARFGRSVKTGRDEAGRRIRNRHPGARRRRKQRGAKALAQVLGWGESAMRHHLTQPHPEETARRGDAMAIGVPE